MGPEEYFKMRGNGGHREINCERSELSGLFNARIFYMYISGRTSCRKSSKCFYLYLNIRPMRYSARIESAAWFTI